VTSENRIKQRFYWLAALALVPVAVAGQDLRSSVRSRLEAKGLGADGLRIISNVLEHDSRPPPRAPVIVTQALRDPLAATDASALFALAVPTDIRTMGELPPASQADFNAALERYIGELAEAQAELMAAVAPFDEEALLSSLEQGIPSQHVAALHRAVDLERLDRARAAFIGATTRFVAEMRTASFPPPQTFQSAVGTVVIGSRGNDEHASGAALIIDPGGDDLYHRAPAKAGAISVVVDLAGNDRYEGRDIAVHALSAMFDLAGDDVYLAAGAGLAVAMAGVSLLVDLEGNDQYESGVFGQASALFGWAALVDGAGDDRYRVTAFGQGYASTAGVALLWDRNGNDTYVSAGLADPFGRGGGLSFTQGAASGWRGELGGGIGILRDDAGDDRYESQMFAQGSGYYYALGLLWDGAGNDQYSAVRYAQGTAAHEAAGLLDDAAGNDVYALSVGVGQGMGLDLAVGVLMDRGGDDSYRSVFLAQGTASANGFGLLADQAGANSFDMSADPRSWGEAQWLRGLPSVGVLLGDRAQSRFTRSSVTVPAQFTGKHEIEPGPDCKANPEAVRAIIADPARHLGDEQLPCAIEAATTEERSALWSAFDVALGLPNAPFLQPIAYALKARPGPEPLMQKVAAILKTHPRCAARALWAASWASADEAKAELDSPCWRLQAAALERLKALSVAPPASASRPVFLRAD
jgi:hypothetical protein